MHLCRWGSNPPDASKFFSTAINIPSPSENLSPWIASFDGQSCGVGQPGFCPSDIIDSNVVVSTQAHRQTGWLAGWLTATGAAAEKAAAAAVPQPDSEHAHLSHCYTPAQCLQPHQRHAQLSQSANTPLLHATVHQRPHQTHLTAVQIPDICSDC